VGERLNHRGRTDDEVGVTLTSSIPDEVAAPPQLDALLADLNSLPAQRGVLLHVVRVADDPASSLRGLGEAAARDPAFTARMLQLANSAYYGRAGRVTSIGPAVALLGGETVRGLAVTMALGLTGEHGVLPGGFWERATTPAAASQLIAPATGAPPGDAFCVGLLHEVGRPLLFRAAPVSAAALSALVEGAARAAAERAWCGTTSGELAAAALTAAGLPATLCRTIADHQLDEERGTAPGAPLPRALRGGVVLAGAVATGEVDDAAIAALHALTSGGLSPSSVRALALRTAGQAAALSAAMR
jgi:HD-like signal output (HDOD) protein